MKFLKDKYGFTYTTKITGQECRLATELDFHPDIINKYQNQGLPYLLYSEKRKRYEAHRFRKAIKGVQPASSLKKLRPFIKANRVYVFINNKSNITKQKSHEYELFSNTSKKKVNIS